VRGALSRSPLSGSRTDPGLETVIGRAPEALWRQTAGEVIVLGPSADDPLVLTGSAAHVWQLLDGRRSLGAITIGLARAYDRPPPAVLEEVLGVISEMVGHGIVIVSAGPSDG
jgi:hypothetical protein